MRIFKYLAAALVALSLLSSCSVLKSVASTALTKGTNAGAALVDLAEVLTSSGAIDLSSITNIINLGNVISGAKSAAKGNESFLESFTKGLISGSKNAVNTSNVSGVINGLKSLANVDTSAIATAAAKAAISGVVPAVSNSAAGVSDTISSIKNILNVLK